MCLQEGHLQGRVRDAGRPGRDSLGEASLITFQWLLKVVKGLSDAWTAHMFICEPRPLLRGAGNALPCFHSLLSLIRGLLLPSFSSRKLSNFAGKKRQLQSPCPVISCIKSLKPRVVKIPVQIGATKSRKPELYTGRHRHLVDFPGGSVVESFLIMQKPQETQV